MGDDERVCLAGEPFEITEAFIECSPVLAKVIRELQSRTKLVEKPLIAPHLRTSDDASHDTPLTEANRELVRLGRHTVEPQQPRRSRTKQARHHLVALGPIGVKVR